MKYIGGTKMAKLGNCCEQTCCVNDAVCCSFDVVTGNAQLIWQDATNFVINGTILLENMGAPGTATATVSVDGVTVLTAAPGECDSITVQDMNSISVAASGGTGTASVKVSFSLNYKF
jgi:Protein of unknown function (DUF3992)